jgi:hypothetical protein
MNVLSYEMFYFVSKGLMRKSYGLCESIKSDEIGGDKV